VGCFLSTRIRSERDVVDVDRLDLGRRGLGVRAAGSRRRRGVHRGVAEATAEAAALAGLTPLERLDAREANLERGPLLAVLALPLAGAQAALGEDLVALAEPLGGSLGGLLPQLDAEPLRLLLPLAVRPLGPVVDGDAQLGDGLAARRVAELGIGR